MTTIPLGSNSEVEILSSPQQSIRVDPTESIQIKATSGVLASVSVVGPGGGIRGVMSKDGSQWIATSGPLAYATTYTVQAKAFDSRGRMKLHRRVFSTVNPEEFFDAHVAPSNGQDVGVGLPLVVTFNKKVSNKAEVEQALVVKTSTPILGAWSWVNDREIEFRPKDLWPGGTEVEIDVNLVGVEASLGVFGNQDTTASFRFRPAVVSVVDARTYTMDVFRDGVLLRKIPVTMGKPGFETRSGTKVLLSKERSKIMDAATGGTRISDPEYYRVTAEYAMRLNVTGEYVHAAPWSTGSQGNDNVSHGCVGMSTENAQWWWNLNNVGDVVIVKNTNRTQSNDRNGITVWNDTWTGWLARSATGAQFTEQLSADRTPAVTATSSKGS